MTHLQSYSYKQRSFLILLPLMLMAISTWSLNAQNTPNLPDDIRQVLLLSVRIFFPGLFAVAVAFLVPTFDRVFQICSVAAVYVASVIFIPDNHSTAVLNPIICVCTAVSSLLAMLPYSSSSKDEPFLNQTGRIFISFIFVVMLPVATFIFIYVVIRQLDIFILYTLDETFGQSFLSIIYVPIYLLLQSVGFHDLVGELITSQYHNSMVTAFVNTIILTNLFSLPATIFIRSFFTKRHVRLFLTLMVVICIMTGSIGACVSLSLLMLLIFFPGSFCIFLGSAMLCFTLSYFLQVPAITTVDNLYLPNITLSRSRMFLNQESGSGVVLEAFAVFVPMFTVILSMFINREKKLSLRRKMRSSRTGFSINANDSPELLVLGYIRVLGGISNVADVEEDGSWLYVQVVNPEAVSIHELKVLVNDKVLVDRINKLYLCEIGDQCGAIYKRISRLIENPYGQSEIEVPLSTPFPISSLSDNEAYRISENAQARMEGAAMTSASRGAPVYGLRAEEMNRAKGTVVRAVENPSA